MERKRLNGNGHAKPDKPKGKYAGGKPRKNQDGMTKKQVMKMNALYQITPEQVNDAIIANKGVLTDAAEQLGVRRIWLRKFVQDRKSCMAIWKEAREEMGDLAEKKLFELIDEGHFPAITFYLSTVHRSRGYGLGRNAVLPGITNNTITNIDTVNVVAVPNGKYLSAEDIKALSPVPEPTMIEERAREEMPTARGNLDEAA